MKRALFALMIFLMTGANFAYAACSGLHNYQFSTLQGKQINLCDYQNRPILVVNTASKCGFTPQFEKLEGMYKKYKDKGLVIVGFPSNDFKQEPGSNAEIGEFCKMTYAVQFPMAAKSSVVGPNANPLYKKLATITQDPPTWNFYKYLILPEGKEVYSYSSDVDPESAQIVSRFKPYLK